MHFANLKAQMLTLLCSRAGCRRYEERGQLLNDDVANLERCVRTCRYTLFCLDPNCVSLTRIWCVRGSCNDDDVP